MGNWDWTIVVETKHWEFRVWSKWSKIAQTNIASNDIMGINQEKSLVWLSYYPQKHYVLILCHVASNKNLIKQGTETALLPPLRLGASFIVYGQKSNSI